MRPGPTAHQASRRTDSTDVLDRYLLAKTRLLVTDVTTHLDALDTPLAAQAIRDFADVLTNWYVRRSRDKFWLGAESSDSAKAAFDTLYTALETLARVAAPLAPLVSEEVWKGLTGGRSVHLTDFPSADEFPADDALVAAMDRVRDVASKGLALRKATGKRVRLPLATLTLVVPDTAAVEPFVDILRDELNVKRVVLEPQAEESLAQYGIERKLAVNARAAGPRIGKAVQQVIPAAKRGDWVATESGVTVGGIDLVEGEYTLDLTVADASTAVAFLDGGGFVVLDTDDHARARGRGARPRRRPRRPAGPPRRRPRRQRPHRADARHRRGCRGRRPHPPRADRRGDPGDDRRRGPHHVRQGRGHRRRRRSQGDCGGGTRMSDRDDNDPFDPFDAAGPAADGIEIPVGPPADADPIEAVPFGGDDAEVKRVEAALYARIGEQSPEHRLTATRRAVELLGDPHLAYPVIHLTGTNGKTSTARMTESIIRAHGLRTGLMTSPHLVSIRERIVIDGQPIAPDRFVENWDDITPILAMTDKELTDKGELPLTFFEALTVLALACFAEAPVDVAVIEVGMGGEWDSTNVVQSQVQVFTPIAIDHAKQLGNTVAEIARTKSGIIKPSSAVVSSAQVPEALAELERAAELTESTLAVEGVGLQPCSTSPRPSAGSSSPCRAWPAATTTCSCRCSAHTRPTTPRSRSPRSSRSSVGARSRSTRTSSARASPVPPARVVCSPSPRTRPSSSTPRTTRTVRRRWPRRCPSRSPPGTWSASSGSSPTRTPAASSERSRTPSRTFVVTQPPGERALDADAFARVVVDEVGNDRVVVEPSLAQALSEARDLADEAEADDAMVLVAGSIVMVGAVMDLVHTEGESK